MAVVDVDGTKLYWEESGTGEPLLLIQGLGYSGAMWHRVVPAFEQRYRVIRYDARGIGRSDVPEGQYTIDLMASDAMAVLDAAGVDRAHVLGASLGGIVAQEVALSHPSRTQSLMLVCTHPAGTAAEWPGQDVLTMLAERAALPFEEAVRVSIPFGYAPTTDPARIEEDIALRLAIPTSPTGYERQLFGGLGYPGTHDRLGQIAVPTLVLTGDVDRMVPPANTTILADAIAGARKVIIPGAGHIVFSDAPEAFVDSILAFLDDVTSASAHDTGAG
jgi:pimeloyl-ACP methyl ester carboxylesterase